MVVTSATTVLVWLVAVRPVAVIVRVAPEIEAGPPTEVLEASGHLVTPGLIDLHVHVYPGVSHYGVDPDSTCLTRGVTTVCDAGSAGADTFEGLRRYVISVSETRVLAFLIISSIGMVSPLNNELEDLRNYAGFGGTKKPEPRFSRRAAMYRSSPISP